MSRDWRQRGGEGGFVLLELLVGLILLSLTIGLFAMTFGLGTRVADAGRARERIAGFAAGTSALSSWLAAAVPLPQPGAAEPRVLFEGSQTALAFVTLSNGDAQQGGLLAISIAIAESGTQPGAVVFRSSLAPLGTVFSASGGEETLLRQVISAQFSYFGSPSDNVPESWRPDWRNASRLPRLVRLTLQIYLFDQLREFELDFRILAG